MDVVQGLGSACPGGMESRRPRNLNLRPLSSPNAPPSPPPRHDILKSRLQRGERVNVFAIGRIFHPNIIEMYGIHGGFQGFWIDEEHTGLGMKEIELATMAGPSRGTRQLRPPRPHRLRRSHADV